MLLHLSGALRQSLRNVDSVLLRNPKDIKIMAEKQRLVDDIRESDKLVIKLQSKVLKHFEVKYDMKFKSFTKVKANA